MKDTLLDQGFRSRPVRNLLVQRVGTHVLGELENAKTLVNMLQRSTNSELTSFC